MEILSEGFGMARTDFAWGGIEYIKGQYSFSNFDVLAASVKANNVTPMWILDYGNSLYVDPNNNNSTNPETPAQIAAMTAYANASIAHFRDLGMYSPPEPFLPCSNDS